MPEPARHPSARDLAAFAAGQLAGKPAAEIAGHLAQCTECRRAVGKEPAGRRGQTVRPGEPAQTTAEVRLAVEGVPAELADSDKYEVVGKLGEGGMGAVWKAKHQFLDCLVAIKVMRGSAAEQAELHERFRQEMRVSGKLKHARIVRALDAERVGDLLLLVMEYVEGVTLERLVAKKGPVPVHHACRLIAEAAEGLQHAHEAGLVHRDVKPGNLMLTAAT